VTEYLAGLKKCIDALSVEGVAKVIQTLESAYEEDRQVFVIGNGGSAGTASHMAADLCKTILPKDPAAAKAVRRFRVMALTDNVPWMTAIANDISYADVFSEQLKTWARPGDIVIAITGSGNSPNILEGLKTSKQLGLHSVGLLGFEGGKAAHLVDQAVVVRNDSFGFIEDLHGVLNHLITAFFSEKLRRSGAAAASQVALVSAG
jgi:D-sedoheptulose 7-phosphate isomerase